MQSVGLVGLVQMDLPDGTVRLTDGGVIDFSGERFRDRDPVWGGVGGVDALGEGIGDEVPALQMTLLPPGTTTPGQIHQTGMQTSRVRFWIGEYVPATGLIDGTPDLMFDGELDQCSLEIAGKERRVALSVVSTAERLFERNSGNSMNPVFHKAVWPGELGHDNATGLGIPVAWGAASPSGGGAVAYTPVSHPAGKQPADIKW